MTTPRRILFLCSSDYGQANVILATAHAVLATGSSVELHIASENRMEPQVQDTVRLADKMLPEAAPYQIHFHGIDGISQFQAMSRPETGIMQSWELPLPNFSNASQFMKRFSYGAMPWEPPEVVEIYTQVVKIIKEVNPDLTVVDPLYVPALTAAYNLKLKWTVLAPNTIKDFAVPLQPYAAALWKYPVIGSALPYPIPWYLIPMNAALLIRLVYTMLTDTRMKTATKLLRKSTGDEKLELITLAELGVVKPPPPGVRLLLGMSEDLDYPFSVLPAHVTPCGPIVRPAKKLANVDSELDKWLSKGPTVYINLGTQLAVKPDEALEITLALRDLLDTAEKSDVDDLRKLQILWKMKRKPTENETDQSASSWSGPWKAVRDTLEKEIEADRVRITSWVEADPCSILQSGHIICSVHHGGANSHHEAIVAGVPQVLVPGWIDCYDFGNRVELNGVGVWASKKAAPRWERVELGNALKEVLISERAAQFRDKAKEIAMRHPEHAGRDKAATLILDILDSK
ncbi:Cyanidin-3-O-glucoside 2-O-glucuronosyltransferase [Cytospora mali]|uniref:Cyanidin-3-O-glucoside 2-O-glucuronosyltransferase n=1 Tax=Cytospora mali TaxID=578113 RepID=A0A194UR49_CYTMA|nr:Cyanidin-3-O-glucoside 2-O-glucuronosyltransferase [Valsa mali var. pyri (nom. inval.)]